VMVTTGTTYGATCPCQRVSWKIFSVIQPLKFEHLHSPCLSLPLPRQSHILAPLWLCCKGILVFISPRVMPNFA
jgi:hypothetical protein